MRKFLLCFLALMVGFSAFAEKKVGSWHSTYFEKDFDVEAARGRDNSLSIYIGVSGEYDHSKVFFNLKGEDIQLFVDGLKQLKEKFVEWTKVAEENNVTDMRKDFNISLPRVTVCWSGSEWWFSFRHKLSPRFIVFNDGSCACVMSGKVSSSSNQYIDAEYYFVLSTASDFDDLIEAITPANVEKYLGEEKNKADLFN